MSRLKKVVWLCAFSDQKLRANLSISNWYWGNILRRILGQKFGEDVAVWDTNAIAEYEKIGGLELHVIVAHCGVNKTQEFVENGIHYHVVWSDYDVIAEKVKRKLNLRNMNSFPHFRKKIAQVLNQVKPDLVHVIGIENMFHSMSVLDMDKDIPVIAQLQTLVSDERFKVSCGCTEKEYQFDSDVEKAIFHRVDYVGTMVPRFREVIAENIKPNAVFIDTTLPLTEEVSASDNEKRYDFVYFAANISKAADWAIEAFILAAKVYPSITLDIVGGYDKGYKAMLEARLKEHNLLDNVRFEGKLPTHDDVIRQIRYARFALLPLKIDIVSGTIREAMANGLPVVTTITPGTPALNEERECVLISEPEDYQAMADNMLELINNPTHADELKQNALKLAGDRVSNSDVIRGWLKAYNDILDKAR